MSLLILICRKLLVVLVAGHVFATRLHPLMNNYSNLVGFSLVRWSANKFFTNSSRSLDIYPYSLLFWLYYPAFVLAAWFHMSFGTLKVFQKYVRRPSCTYSQGEHLVLSRLEVWPGSHGFALFVFYIRVRISSRSVRTLFFPHLIDRDNGMYSKLEGVALV